MILLVDKGLIIDFECFDWEELSLGKILSFLSINELEVGFWKPDRGLSTKASVSILVFSADDNADDDNDWFIWQVIF